MTQPGITAYIDQFANLATTGGRYMWAGYAWWPDGSASKTITRLGFRFGTVVKAGGSGLTVSLQNVSASATTALQPDDTQDQTVAVNNGDAGFASNTWYRTNVLSSGRTVTYGERLAVVFEFDASGRLGVDTASFAIAILEGQQFSAFEDGNSFSPSSWSSGTNRKASNIVFEFSDGTFGCFGGYGFVFSDIDELTYNEDSAGADEYALEFGFTHAAAVEGAGWVMRASGDDVDVVLYRGTTALATKTLNGNHVVRTTARHPSIVLFDAPIELTANVTYRLSIKPTTANNIIVPYFDVDQQEHLDLHLGGRVWRLNGRLNGGAWSGLVTTRRPFIWPILSGW